MSKFNTATARSRNGIGPITSNTTFDTRTFNGAPAVTRDAKSELFLAAVSDFGGEATFYESADSRSERIARLAREVAVADTEWTVNFVTWLRNEANMRTVSVVVALEAAKALYDNKISGARKLVAGAIRRADEPGEALAYWHATFGRKIPIAVKRGIADAVSKTFNEFSVAKYDTDSHGYRFGDIIELVHPTPRDDKQESVFRFALNRRYNPSDAPEEALTMLQKRAELLALSPEEKRKLITKSKDASAILKGAGLTWEALSGSVSGGMDAKMWEAVIPTMGYMALLRNLRKFEKAGVSDAVLDKVAARIADADEVARSRQLPFRFLSAYRALSGSQSLRFAYPLEKALNASLANVPALKGNTLIMVDRSGSMFWEHSKNTEMTFADTAAIFGSALAMRAENATLVQFGSHWQEIRAAKGASVLKVVDAFGEMGGTETQAAVRAHFRPGYHTRVVVITDEQNSPLSNYYGLRSADVYGDIPKTIPVYTWNLKGYSKGQGVSGVNRTYLGGLTDQSFKLIPMLEAGHDAGWPWETNA